MACAVSIVPAAVNRQNVPVRDRPTEQVLQGAVCGRSGLDGAPRIAPATEKDRLTGRSIGKSKPVKARAGATDVEMNGKGHLQDSAASRNDGRPMQQSQEAQQGCGRGAENPRQTL